MKRTEAESIGDVLRQAIDEQNMTARLLETRACSLWSAIVGPGIAGRTSKPSMRAGIMTVGVPNAALRSDLNMSRSSIIRIINQTLKSDVVADIRFTS